MSDIIDFQDYRNRDLEKDVAKLRAHAKNFGIAIAKEALKDGCPFPLSLQCICSGWDGYVEYDKGDWFLPGFVPSMPSEGQTPNQLRLEFLNGIYPGSSVEKGPKVMGSITLQRHFRTTTSKQEQTFPLDFCQAVGKTRPKMVLVALMAFRFILYFAKKDMGFQFHSMEVKDDVVTLTIDALTERMILSFDGAQAEGQLEVLKLQSERQHRRDGTVDTCDWDAFNIKDSLEE